MHAVRKLTVKSSVIRVRFIANNKQIRRIWEKYSPGFLALGTFFLGHENTSSVQTLWKRRERNRERFGWFYIAPLCVYQLFSAVWAALNSKPGFVLLACCQLAFVNRHNNKKALHKSALLWLDVTPLRRCINRTWSSYESAAASVTAQTIESNLIDISDSLSYLWAIIRYRVPELSSCLSQGIDWFPRHYDRGVIEVYWLIEYRAS